MAAKAACQMGCIGCSQHDVPVLSAAHRRMLHRAAALVFGLPLAGLCGAVFMTDRLEFSPLTTIIAVAIVIAASSGATRIALRRQLTSFHF